MIVTAPEVMFIRQHGLRLDCEPYCGRWIAERLTPSKTNYVLADGQYIAAVMHAGHTPLVNDSFLMRLLIEKGALSPRGILESIDRGDVEYLVLKRPIEEHQQQIGRVVQKWAPEILDAMQQHYRLVAAREELFVFIYRRK
jgi:hypothetical protein